MSHPPRPSFKRTCIGPIVIALLAGVITLLQIDPAGDIPNAPQGPGLTVDECFNVQQGVYLTTAIRMYGLSILHPTSLQEVFQNPNHLPDHPPLGRLWLGLCHDVTRHFTPSVGADRTYSTACARTGSAMAFALLVFLVGAAAGTWYGTTAGCGAALSLVLMPRVFGHAHLASLETVMGLSYTAAVLAVAILWHADKRPSWKAACIAGIIFGLALLTKIQAVLLVPVVAAWAFWRWKHRAIMLLAVWGLTGLIVFFCGWPWLWLDPVHHLIEYFARMTDRAQLSVWYFGEKFSDRDVPWHYPFVLFLTTVPIGLHLLGGAGVVSNETPAWKNSREQLLLGCILFPLILFAWPGIAVYDGARLFLVVFPLWAILIGRGVPTVSTWLTRRCGIRTGRTLLTALLIAQGYGVVAMSPCFLSYHNLLVGGLRGAERLGLEPTYWGDSLTRNFLQDVCRAVPEGSLIAATPSFYDFQWDELLRQSPILRRHELKIERYGTPEAQAADYVLLFFRKSDLPPHLRAPQSPTKPLVALRREDVLLAALYAAPNLTTSSAATP